eukprot:14394921-Ditylum_brightwellii.AAC.1
MGDFNKYVPSNTQSFTAYVFTLLNCCNSCTHFQAALKVRIPVHSRCQHFNFPCNIHCIKIPAQNSLEVT